MDDVALHTSPCKGLESVDNHGDLESRVRTGCLLWSSSNGGYMAQRWADH